MGHNATTHDHNSCVLLQLTENSLSSTNMESEADTRRAMDDTWGGRGRGGGGQREDRRTVAGEINGGKMNGGKRRRRCVPD